MTTTLKVTVRYDGTAFAGWQTQPDQRTVQGELERALGQIAQEHVRIVGASRTDAGAHALGQVFSCAWPGRPGPERLRHSLSQMLRPDIRVERVEHAAPGFDARAAARRKRYAYTLSLVRHADPFSARYAWTVPGSINPDRLAELVTRLEGEHDFAGFQASGAAVQTTVRTMDWVRVRPGGVIGPCDAEGLVHVEFCAKGFLYKMVRNMMGTLVDVVRGAVSPERLDERLASPGPYHGYTAPAHGLALLEVEY